jgi:DNA polymerase-3 subunit epsilon
MISLSKEIRTKLLTQGLTHTDLQKVINSDEIPFYLDFFKLQGLELILKDDHYIPKQLLNTISETTFCIVDIETNGGKAQRDEMIELGAVILKNGEVIERFDTLIKTETLPDPIAQLTRIALADLKKAPTLNNVMQAFRSFAKDHIIVAHPLKFDYEFISASFEKVDLGTMLNLGICNIALAERTLSSAKYGLHYLNKTLGLEEDFKQHRAYNDAIITKDIFLKSLENLPKEVTTIKDLIEFTKKGKKKPRAALVKFD